MDISDLSRFLFKAGRNWATAADEVVLLALDLLRSGESTWARKLFAVGFLVADFGNLWLQFEAFVNEPKLFFEWLLLSSFSVIKLTEVKPLPVLLFPFIFAISIFFVCYVEWILASLIAIEIEINSWLAKIFFEMFSWLIVQSIKGSFSSLIESY